jgi:hypothetical protein
MHQDSEDEQERERSSVYDPLGWPARAGATAVGIGTAGAGAIAVFVTENQAGAATLLVIAAAFLLIGIQGTPLIRIGAGQNSVELARIRRRVRQIVEEATSDQQSPDVARGMVEAASFIDPDAGVPASISAYAFEQQIMAALARVTQDRATSGVAPVGVDGGIDFVVSAGTNYANVIVKYLRRGQLPIRVVREAQGVSALPALIVTNAPLSGAVQEHNRSASSPGGRTPYVEVVTWNGVQDDDVLGRTLDRLLRAT